MTTPADHHRWRAERFVAVAAPTGPLALVETRWTADGADITAAAAQAGPGRTVTPIERRSPQTGEIEHGLRVWDADSPAIRAYDRIDTFRFDPAWVRSGRFVPAASDRYMTFPHRTGSREHASAGEVVVTLEGAEYSLAVIDDGGDLLVVFADDTTGTETYGSGRFLRVAPSGEDGAVLLDFNRSFLPPSAFCAQYDCPQPPASHRFRVPVPAGEKNVVFVDGFRVDAH